MLYVTVEAERYIEEHIETDCFFCHKATRKAYDTFICTTLDSNKWCRSSGLPVSMRG